MASVWVRVLVIGLVGVSAGALATAVLGSALGGRQSVAPTTSEGAGAPASSPAASQHEVLAQTEAYLAAIEPLAREVGWLVEQVLEPAIGRSGTSAADGTPSAGRSRDVTSSLQHLYDRWILAEPPRALEEAHALFVVALDHYADIAEQLAAPEPAALPDDVVALAEEAGDLYARAAQLVQQHLTAHDVDPVGWLPHAGAP